MVTVIVPWRPSCIHRSLAWAWVKSRYALEHPAWQLIEAQPPPDGEWCKAAAVNPAIQAAADGVIVVADADVWCDRIADAVLAVTSGAAAWAIPHWFVHRLTAAATVDLLDSPGTRMGDGSAEISGSARAGTGQARQTCRRPYTGWQGGGIVVAHRDTLLDVPLDPRFTGWGQEDISWAMALLTLHGACWRGSADLIHLWHPPQERLTNKVGTLAGQTLHRRYIKARRDPALMRALLEEATP